MTTRNLAGQLDKEGKLGEKASFGIKVMSLAFVMLGEVCLWDIQIKMINGWLNL